MEGVGCFYSLFYETQLNGRIRTSKASIESGEPMTSTSIKREKMPIVECYRSNYLVQA